jgi:transcriptional regulator with XRE-family HTH domain
VTDELTPRRRGRTRAQVPDGMPVVPDARGSEREALSLWWKERIQDIERIYEERIQVLRTVGEHPSPVFAKIVRMDGALGMPKSLLAKKLGMSVTMLTQYYGDEYDLGAAEMLSQIAANMLRIGTSMTDPAAAKVGMQILDRRGGEEWRPPAQKLQLEDERDKPPVIDSSKLTYEERQALREMLMRVANGGEGDPIEDDQALIGEGPSE